MAVGKYEPISFFPKRIFGVVVKKKKKKGEKTPAHPKGPRRMARPGLNKHLNNRLANFTRLKFQFFYFFLVKNMRHYFVAILKIIAKATINPAIANSKLAIGQNLARPFETK